MSEFEKIPTERKKLSQYVFANARTLIIVLILFAVVVVMTTDIRSMTVSSITDLGLEFFVILFASYSMFVCCADGGVKSGYATDIYTNAVAQFSELKGKTEETILTRVGEFCNYYIEEELRKTRMQYLSVACIPYDVYMANYVKLGAREINALTDLTSAQKQAVKRANKVHRIRLTPEMIMTQGKTVHTRSILATTPDMMKTIVYGAKILRMSLVSICMSLIALDVILEPSWTVFAEVCLKLATVVINGFGGHKDGFNNITVHTVNYINSQASLMRQALQYCAAHPLTND